MPGRDLVLERVVHARGASGRPATGRRGSGIVLRVPGVNNQWLAGLICGALYNWLLYRTRSVFACVVAHAVSNAALAAWVLARGDWKFW